MLIDGVDLREVTLAPLRERVVLVPQEGFLFDGTVAGQPALRRAPRRASSEVRLALTELGLLDWADGLPHGVETPVGQRGESLSAGERQLVALTRAYLADPDLLVLDEATSSVDPATEVRIPRALDGLTAAAPRSRSPTGSPPPRRPTRCWSDAGRLVEVGPHARLVAADGPLLRAARRLARARAAPGRPVPGAQSGRVVAPDRPRSTPPWPRASSATPPAWSASSSSSTTPARCSWSAGWTTRLCAVP